MPNGVDNCDAPVWHHAPIQCKAGCCIMIIDFKLINGIVTEPEGKS